jgi:hypothetical protein
MRSVPVRIAMVIGAAAVIAGCGQHPGSGAAAPAPSISPSISPSSSPSAVSVACRGGTPATHASKLTIIAADNGRSFCVGRGSDVTVILTAVSGRKWSAVHVSSAALRPRGDATMVPVGVTVAAYVAAQPGTAIIMSGRPACGPPASPRGSTPGPGTLECDAILAFRVTVTVVG